MGVAAAGVVVALSAEYALQARLEATRSLTQYTQYLRDSPGQEHLFDLDDVEAAAPPGLPVRDELAMWKSGGRRERRLVIRMYALRLAAARAASDMELAHAEALRMQAEIRRLEAEAAARAEPPRARSAESP
jgi:hypothetical protein